MHIAPLPTEGHRGSHSVTLPGISVSHSPLSTGNSSSVGFCFAIKAYEESDVILDAPTKADSARVSRTVLVAVIMVLY